MEQVLLPIEPQPSPRAELFHREFGKSGQNAGTIKQIECRFKFAHQMVVCPFEKGDWLNGDKIVDIIGVVVDKHNRWCWQLEVER